MSGVARELIIEVYIDLNSYHFNMSFCLLVRGVKISILSSHHPLKYFSDTYVKCYYTN